MRLFEEAIPMKGDDYIYFWPGACSAMQTYGLPGLCSLRCLILAFISLSL